VEATTTTTSTAIANCVGPLNKVKIQTTSSTILHLYELRILSGGTNVALNKVASSSSTYMNNSRFAPSKGVDGDSTTFFHTKMLE
jgi:hypothetical protein